MKDLVLDEVVQYITGASNMYTHLKKHVYLWSRRITVNIMYVHLSLSKSVLFIDE